MKNGAKSLRQIAERRVAQYIRERSGAWEHVGEVASDAFAAEIVDLVLEIVAKPDHDMLKAGLYEIGLALPAQARPAYRRQLVTTMWNAMMDRAR